MGTRSFRQNIIEPNKGCRKAAQIVPHWLHKKQGSSTGKRHQQQDTTHKQAT